MDESVLAYAADQGWSVEFTSADASYSNAQIENKHFRICQSARAMLDHACQKQTFWESAVAQATTAWNYWFSSHLANKHATIPLVKVVHARELKRYLKLAGKDL